MTPREIQELAEQKAARKSLAADIAELGPPTGWIVVCERTFAWWCEQPMAFPVPDPNAPSASCSHAPGVKSAPEGAIQDHEVPF